MDANLNRIPMIGADKIYKRDVKVIRNSLRILCDEFKGTLDIHKAILNI